MTMEEAVLLVLQAGAFGEGGDVLVLDMGEPVKIVDLATRIAYQLRPGEPPNIVFAGLPSGEKLHEVLTSPADERAQGLTRLSGLTNELGISDLNGPESVNRSLHRWQMVDGTRINLYQEERE